MPPKVQKKESPAAKKQKVVSTSSTGGVVQGPIRWEHCFSSDFGPNWHLAYTSDEVTRVAQRHLWIEQLIGKREQTEFERNARDEFTYSNFYNFYKFNFKIFDSIIKSCLVTSGGTPPQVVKEAPPAKTEPTDVKTTLSSPADSPTAFLMLNGSIKVAIDDSREFLIGRTSCVNDLGDNLTAPDLNLKNLTTHVSRRHCGVSNDGGDWRITNYSKLGISVNGVTITGIKESVKLENDSRILIGTEVFLKFFSA